ncbi:MAG: hypothetical protein ABI824_13495 [Acidobacteriota bacterium]
MWISALTAKSPVWIAAPILLCGILLSVPVRAQQRTTSPTGFGRILFPGGTSPKGAGGSGTVSPFGRVLFPGGTAPAGVASPQNSGKNVFPGGGAPATIRPGSSGAGLLGYRPPITHQSHSALIPILIPVYGSGYFGYDAPIAQYAPTATYPATGSTAPYGSQTDDGTGAQASPVVIINQYFRPDAAVDTQRDAPRDYQPQDTPAPSIAQAPVQTYSQPEGPVFLIAMKDHTIYSANAYWIEDGVLNYVTLHGDENSASMELVDRELSRRLNRDRKVSFGLPEN